MYGSSHGGSKCHHSDHYDTKKAAKQAARRMGMDGCHSMTCNGNKVYMPGDSHSDYMDYNEGSPVDLPGFK
jgi:hypothetical protein